MDETPATPKNNLTTELTPRLTASGWITRLSARSKGVSAALTSAFFLGMAPVFGKQAILMGIPPLAVVAFRTSIAAIVLVLVVFIFYRRYLYIYPTGLLGCLLAGWINGLGSLFYYSALARLDASVGHLLYSLYPLFLVLWLTLDRQPPRRLTMIQLLLAIPAVYLLTGAGNGKIDLLGVFEMLLASALYALHLPITQRVLYDVPAPTVTLYTLIAMSTVVVPAFLILGQKDMPIISYMVWPLLGLTMVTFLSRLMLFTGIKHLGGMQTALLGLSEMVVAVLFSNLLLGEKFNAEQWIGAILLVLSLALVGFNRSYSSNESSGWLSWLRSPGPTNNYPWQPDK